MIQGKRVIASVEARYGSERFAGKVLADCEGQPMLSRLIARVLQSRFVDEVVIATTLERSDEIAACATSSGAKVFKGSEENVMDRVYRAHCEANSEIVVQLTGDNPLVDPQLVDHLVRLCSANFETYDFVANTRILSYCSGFEVQVMPFRTLEKAAQLGTDEGHREHVCLLVHERPEEFRFLDIVAPPDCCRPEYRLTLDTPQDAEVITQVFKHFGGNNVFGVREIMAYLDSHPEIAAINAEVRDKPIR